MTTSDQWKAGGPISFHWVYNGYAAHVIWYMIPALGIPGNILSAIVWLRRHVVSKNSSAIYFAALAINDHAHQLFEIIIYGFRCFNCL